MNVNEIRTAARDFTVNALTDVLKANNAIQFDDASWAIAVDVDGQIVYTEVSVKTKAWKATKTTDAFSPETAIAKWEAEKEERAQKAAEKAAKKKA